MTVVVVFYIFFIIIVIFAYFVNVFFSHKKMCGHLLYQTIMNYKVLVIGYYDRQNYGDDLFKIILSDKFNQFTKRYSSDKIRYSFEFCNLEDKKNIDNYFWWRRYDQ
jgi:hypothetical protein